jgi:hypothetical protein
MCFKKYTLLHPEEKPDFSITINNYNLDKVFDKWFKDYQVPYYHFDYWRNKIEINVTDTLNYPAATWDIPNGRHLAIRPEYLNAGVLAHEQAHNSLSLLNITDKANFAIDLEALKKTDKMLQYLFKEKPYASTSYVEAHAEIYRYIDVPQSLRRYYSKLYS